MQKIIITSGYFNPLHIGHINLMRDAKKLGDFLIVIVNNDEQVKVKGSTPFMPEAERMEIVKAIKYVDDIFLSIDKTIGQEKSLEVIANRYKGHKLFFAKGGDRNINNLPPEERRVCEEFQIEVINGIGGGKVQSSSWLLKNIKNI